MPYLPIFCYFLFKHNEVLQIQPARPQIIIKTSLTHEMSKHDGSKPESF